MALQRFITSKQTFNTKIKHKKCILKSYEVKSSVAQMHALIAAAVV
jgi:hypothetical protein